MYLFETTSKHLCLYIVGWHFEVRIDRLSDMLASIAYRVTEDITSAFSVNQDLVTTLFWILTTKTKCSQSLMCLGS